MATFPLIVRELRALSRQGQLFWLRVVGAAAGFATLAFLLLQNVFVGAQLGLQIFAALNVILLLTILLVGPLATSDCIAQEKREGTLGLLFLAPLTSRDIVLSKLAINAVRAFTLLFAVLPMMVLPLVFGGIPGRYLLTIVLAHITALSIALAAGILASTLYRTFIQAAVLAEIYTFLFAIPCLLLIRSNSYGVGCLLGIMIGAIVIQYCSEHLKQKWEEDAADYQEPFWVRFFSDSLFQEVFRWDTRRARSSNPIAWLQEYSWSARLAKWGWFALAIFAEFWLMVTVIGSNIRSRPGNGQSVLAMLIVVGISLSGANSFRSERLSGAMELLLVTPLSAWRIILGRLWGIWVHFFPAVAVVVVTWFGSGHYLSLRSNEAYILISSYIFVPMIGLYISMLPWNVLVAWAVIFCVGLVFPIYGAQLWSQVVDALPVPAVIVIQTFLGLAALSLLHRKLERRSFLFQAP